MSLNIMIAGCTKDERERIEASVRAAFTGRPEADPWNVSLVRLGDQWSIDIDGPEPQFKGISVVAPADDLTGSLERAIGAPRPVAPPATGSISTPAAAPSGNGAPASNDGARKDRHECEECAAAFEVLFDKLAGEREELCPVACPACWHVNKVPIAEAAGATGDYRAEAVG
jgi:hypothetical protein